MPEFCTCGAELPADALFCHKCGKPQREIRPVQEAEESAPPAPAGAFELRTRIPLGFRNPIALRVGMLMAGLATLVSMLIGVLALVWFFAAAFAAPFAYGRRMGSRLSIREGARMGGIVGVFACALTGVMSLAGLLVSDRSFSEVMREQIEGRSLSSSEMEIVLSVLRSPAGIILMFALTFGFLLLLCTAGGALGAKIAQKD
jgi:hypothetical protein